MYGWHNKIGNYEDDANKNKFDWWGRHKSSKSNSGKFDISVDINYNVFWEKILPIFYKYYNNIGKNFSKSEIINDLKLIKSKAKELKHIKYDDCYKEISKERII